MILTKVHLCLALIAVFALNVSGRRNNYNNNNNNNNNNQNGAFNRASSNQLGDIDNPEEEGNQIEVVCPASYSGAPVISCLWKHQLPTNGQSNSRHITCGANGCSGSDLDQSYLNGHSVEYNQQPCSLRIQQASPDDSGDWECHLQTDDGSISGLISSKGTIEVFVSNKTELYISDPDDDDAIEYDLGRSSDRIEATCTAFGGSPIPTFKWFIDDDKRGNEITEGDGDASFDLQDYDDRNGRRAESKITFKPDLQALCDLNLDEACDVLNDDDDFNGLNFNLICKVEQTQIPQYQSWNDQKQATVMVEVSSASRLIFAVLGHGLRWFFAAILGLGLRWLS